VLDKARAALRAFSLAGFNDDRMTVHRLVQPSLGTDCPSHKGKQNLPWQRN